jgi:hypothetical protein
VRLVDLAQPARADERLDCVRAKPRAGSQGHVVSADSIAALRAHVEPRRNLQELRRGGCAT